MASLANQILEHVGNRLERYGITERAKVGERNIVVAEELMPDDGWITKIGVQAGGAGRNVRADLVLYRGDGNLAYKSGSQTWNSVIQRRESEIPQTREIVAKRGQRFLIGLWSDPDAAIQYGVVSGNGKHLTAIVRERAKKKIEGLNQQGNPVGTWAGFVRNRRPKTGKYPGWMPDYSIKNQTSPVFGGRTPHHPAEGGRDRTSLLHFQIYDKTTERMVYNVIDNPNPLEVKNDYWERRLFVHTAGHDYRVRFRYADRFGLFAPWANWKHYKIVEGPNEGVATAPTSGATVYTQSPSFSGNYSHPNGVAAKQVQVQIFTKDRKVKVVHTDFTNMTGTSFSRTLATLGLSSLARGGRFEWRFRFKDANDIIGEFTEWVPFKINSAPFAPSRLDPSDGVIAPSGRLSCRVLDEDKDNIQSVKFLVTEFDGTILPGYPKAVSGPFKNGSTVTFNAKPDLVNGRSYFWQAWASDTAFEGERSALAGFRFALVPEVASIAPQQSAIINRIKNPSVEYGPDHFRISNFDATLSLEHVEDTESAFGSSCFVARREVSGGTGGEIVSEAVEINPNFSALYHATFKLYDEYEAGTVRSRIFLRCFNSSGLVTGELYRGGTEGGMLDGSTAPARFFEQYGGFVAASSWPAGTVSASVVAVPLSAGAGLCKVDAFFYCEALGNRGGDWFGYFDGDNPGYVTGDEYVWLDEDGYSASAGIPILSEPETTVEITYFSAAGSPKKADQLIIEEYNAERRVWQLVNITPLIDSPRTSIPVPANLLKNQRSYRLFVGVQDQAGTSNRTSYARFDTDFEGPPEPTILEANADASYARISLSWQETTLDQNEFGGYEVAIESEEEGEKRLAILPEVGNTVYTYHWPVSNRAYRMKIRQIQLVGDTEVQSRWSAAEVSVDYFGRYYVKSLTDPELFVAFEPFRGEIPASKTEAEVDEYLPIHALVPSHNVGPARWGSGSFTATLWDDPTLPIRGQEARALAKRADYGDRRMVILSHLPSEKHFVTVREMSYDTDEFLDPVISVEWTQTYYEEDVRLREGVVRASDLGTLNDEI